MSTVPFCKADAGWKLKLIASSADFSTVAGNSSSSETDLGYSMVGLLQIVVRPGYS